MAESERHRCPVEPDSAGHDSQAAEDGLPTLLLSHVWPTRGQTQHLHADGSAAAPGSRLDQGRRPEQPLEIGASGDDQRPAIQGEDCSVAKPHRSATQLSLSCSRFQALD